jgi:hypothetical protein
MTNSKKNRDDLCCRIDPERLAIIGAFLTAVGDTITFISLLIAAQERCNENDNNKNYAEKRIGELEREICKLKEEINYLDLND